LAEQLGAKVQVLRGRNIAEEILSFARTHNVTLIVVGLPRHSFRSRLLRGEVVSRITSHSGQIHVLVIGSTESEKRQESAVPPETLSLSMFYGSLLSVAGTTVFCWIFHQWLGLINTAMILLLPVVYSGMTWGRRAGLAASLMAVMALDFFFVPPRLSLAVADLLYLPMFLVFIVVGIVTSFLADMVRWQGENARQRERFVSALYAFSRDLMETANLEELLRYAANEIAEAFECEVMILLPDEIGQLMVRAQVGEHAIFDERKLGVATWVYRNGQQAGHGTDTLSSATFSYLPLMTKETTIGVLGVGLGRADQLLLPERRRLLEAFTNILALALSRTTNSLSKKEQSK
jgi:two-component system, OmpR family, sensor histidine kinase KdpD